MSLTRKRALIVDDNHDLRELVRMTLAFSDLELHEADNAEEAMQLVKALLPDLILLDIMMPGERNGLELCHEIKNTPELQHIQVIILSAKGQQSDLEAAGKAGADGYFVKPFSPLSLLDSINNSLKVSA